MASGWDIASETDAPLGSTAPTIAGPWDVAHEETVESAKDRMARHSALIAKAPSFVTSAKRVANDVLDTAGSALAVPAAGLTGVASDVLGQSDQTHDAAVKAVHDFVAGPENKDVSAAANALADTGVGQGIKSLAKSGSDTLDRTLGPEAAHAVKRVGSDVLGAAATPGVGGLIREGATAAGVAPVPHVPVPETVVGGATAPDKMLDAAGYRVNRSTRANMTGAEDKPSTLALAGEKASSTAENTAANRLHNKSISNGWAATDIGLPRDTVLSPENIAKAEAGPSATYERVRGALSERAPVSEETAAALRATNAPDVLGRNVPTEHGGTVSLLSTEPMNGGELMDRISALRQEGFKRTTAAPGGQIDPAVEAYGNAQLDAANALEKELNNRVAATNPKLAGDYQAARKLFAKINTVKRSLKGYDVDPAKLDKAAAKTDAIDGGLKIVADAHMHAPNEVNVNVPSNAAFGDKAAVAGASGAAGGIVAAGFGHPTTAALLTALPVAQYGIRKALQHTGGETAAAELDATAQGPLGHYFGRDDSGFHPSTERAPQLDLTPPPGTVFEPHQPSILRSGENVPVAEQGGLPPGLTLQPPEGRAFEPHQPGVLRLGERVPEPETTTTSQPSVKLRPPEGTAFEPHQPDLPLGDHPAFAGPDPDSIDLYHGGATQLTKFDKAKIGTGEGNQAFSHGHYFGEAQAVGEHYIPEKGGYLTHARIPKQIADRMLDWDKPIKDQPTVLAALDVDPDAPVKANGINPEWTGQELHDALVRGKTNAGIKLGSAVADSKAAVSEWLSSKGITGTRYFDGVSRKAGKGTRNTVLFNPDDATVISSTKIEPKG